MAAGAFLSAERNNRRIGSEQELPRCIMKKTISIILVFTMALLAVFASCKKSENDPGHSSSNTSDSIQNDTVTDIDADEISAAGGTAATGSDTASAGGSNTSGGKSDAGKSSQANTGVTNPNDYTTPDGQEITTRKHDNSLATTSPEFTTGKDVVTVPKTTAKGTQVDFSDRDIQNLQYMIGMQGDAAMSYENSEGIPIELACQIALSMSSGETNSPAGQVSLNLFTYFGQTVVGFKTKCTAANSGVTYISSSETYRFSEKASSAAVYLNKFYDLGRDNFYKATGTITFSNKEKKNITVIIQKNKLDKNYGFSVKAQKLD